MLSRLIVIVFFVSLFTSFFLTNSIPQVYAQDYSSNINSLLPDTNPDVPRDTHTLVQSVTFDVMSTMICFLAGIDPLTQNHQCLGYNGKTGKLGYVSQNGGAVGVMISAISMSYNLPVHFGQYISYAKQSFHPLGTPSYAQVQGVGYTGLQPIVQLWKGFRDLAYLFAVVIFIFVGLGIMLRIKIDPRTVMSLQNTIPKIIIGLILITLSFAIVGFFIDMTYVLTLVVLNLIGHAAGDQTMANTLFTANNPYDAINTAFGGGSPNINIGHGTLPNPLNPIVGGFGIIQAVEAGATLIGGIVATAINSNPLGGLINGILSGPFVIYNLIATVANIFGLHWAILSTIQVLAIGFVFIALLVAILVALFRFWIALINCYISILFAVILGPLRILLGILPGSPGGGVGGWFRDLIANLAVFPASLAFIMLTGELARTIHATTTPGANTIFILPLVPGLDVGNMIALVAMIAILPQIPHTVKEALKSKDVFGAQFGTMLGVGTKAVSNTIGGAQAAIGKTPQPGNPGGLYALGQRIFR